MLRVNVFNVGQGAACLLEFGDGRVGIFDCGAMPGGGSPVVARLRELRKTHKNLVISFLALSHLDWDHISGVEELLEDVDLRGRIRRLWCNDLGFRALIKATRKWVQPRQGEVRVAIGDTRMRRRLRSLGLLIGLLDRSGHPSGVRHLEVVAPWPGRPSEYPVSLGCEELLGEFRTHAWAPSQGLRDAVIRGLEELIEQDDPSGIFEERIDWNSASIMLTIEHLGKRILLSGDATRHSWSHILSLANELECDACIAWHHGARLGERGDNREDLRAWSCAFGRREGKFALVSHGAHRGYRHPHREMVSAVAGCGGSVHCTRLRGKAAADREDLGAAEALVQTAGVEDVNLVREASSACYGDLCLEVGRGGKVRLLHSGSHGDRPLAGCCQEGAALAG